jgi:hypothetical protein
MTVFTAFTSTISGVLMIGKPDGSLLQLPLSMLQETPFPNFLVPGILLTTLVGGVNLVAVYFNIQRLPARYSWAMAGGCMICGWIIVQVLLINSIHWLHAIYFCIGLMIVLTAYELKGKWAV